MKCKTCWARAAGKCLYLDHCLAADKGNVHDRHCRAMRAVMRLARKMIKMDCCPDIKKMNACDAETGRPVCVECWARWAVRS